MLLCKLSPRLDHFHRRQGKSSARESLAYLGDQRTFYSSRPEKNKAVLVRRRSYHHSRRPGHSKSCGVERVECCQLLESRRGTLLWTIHRHAGGPRKKEAEAAAVAKRRPTKGELRAAQSIVRHVAIFRGLRGSSTHGTEQAVSWVFERAHPAAFHTSCSRPRGRLAFTKRKKRW